MESEDRGDYKKNMETPKEIFIQEEKNKSNNKINNDKKNIVVKEKKIISKMKKILQKKK